MHIITIVIISVFFYLLISAKIHRKSILIHINTFLISLNFVLVTVQVVLDYCNNKFPVKEVTVDRILCT